MKATTLILAPGFEPETELGVQLHVEHGKPVILLPKWEGITPPEQHRIFLGDNKPPIIAPDKRIHNLFLFKEAPPSNKILALKPLKEYSAVLLFLEPGTPQMIFITKQGKSHEHIPGVQIINNGAEVEFMWEGETYSLCNINGELE